MQCGFSFPYPYIFPFASPPFLPFPLYFTLLPFLPEYSTSRIYPVVRHKGKESSFEDLSQHSSAQAHGTFYIRWSYHLCSTVFPPLTLISPFLHLKCHLHHHFSLSILSQSKLIFPNTPQPRVPPSLCLL